MTSIAKRGGELPSLAPPLAKLPMRLMQEVSRAENPHPSVGYSPGKIPSDVLAEAKEALDLYKSITRPPDRETILLWLMPIGIAVRNPPDDDTIQFYCEHLEAVLSDIPRVMLSRETQVAAMREFSFWPAAADIYKFLVDDACKIVRRRFALAEIVNSQEGMLDA